MAEELESNVSEAIANTFEENSKIETMRKVGGKKKRILHLFIANSFHKFSI